MNPTASDPHTYGRGRWGGAVYLYTSFETSKLLSPKPETLNFKS